MHLSEYLQECEVPFEAILHPPAFTAKKRARFMRVPGREVVKCVLLSAPQGFYVAILRSTDQVHLEAVAAQLGVSVRLANEDELAEKLSDCGRGAVTPFGSLYSLRTLLDDSIQPEDIMIFEAQQHHIAIRMLCRDFERLEKPTRFRFASHDKVIR